VLETGTSTAPADRRISLLNTAQFLFGSDTRHAITVFMITNAVRRHDIWLIWNPMLRCFLVDYL